MDQFINHESQIYYDKMADSPWYRYLEKNGALHEVWFEDPRSLLTKFRLVKEYGLGELGCWHLGTTKQQIEEILL